MYHPPNSSLWYSNERRNDGGCDVAEVPFRLKLVESGDEWVLFCHSPYGEWVSHVRPPFGADELRTILNEVEKSLIRSASPVITRRAGAPERVTRQFGQQLSDTLMAGNVRILFDKCRDKARERGDQLQVLIDPVGPNVSRIPWEFALDPSAGDDYLALRVPVARSLHLMQPVPPLEVAPPLRVLGVMSRPSDLPALEVDAERRQISESLQRLSSDLVKVDWLPGDRWQDVARALRSAPWHVLHFVGHGGFDEDMESGFIELSGDDGRAHQVPAADLARWVYENPELRLVVLNACESATTGAAGAFSSTAAKLLREGVPAVVAMQYEISDPAALAFATVFYEGVARGIPVDRAVTVAREHVKMTFQSLEWATPVLFLASDQTRVFSIPERAAAAAGAASPDWSGPLKDRLTSFFKTTPTGKTTPTSSPPPAQPKAPPQPQPAPKVASQQPATPPPAPPPPRPAQRPAPQAPRRPGPELPLVHRFPAMVPATHAAMGPGDLVAVAGADGSIRVLSLPSGRQLAHCALPRRQRPVRLAWSPWRRHLASQHDDGTVVVWDLETEIPLRVLRPSSPRLDSLAFSGDGNWLAVAGDRQLRVFDAAGREVRAVPVPDAGPGAGDWRTRLQTCPALAFAPDGRHIVVAGDDGAVRQLDVYGRLVTTWRHPQAVTALEVAGDRVATGGADGRVRVWAWDGRLLNRHETPAAVGHLALAPDGRLAAGSADATCWLWDADGRTLGTAALAGPPVGLGFTADGRTLVTATAAGVLESWSLEGDRPRPGGDR
jgi:hypothetical protein